jgi:hypothetical protein
MKTVWRIRFIGSASDDITELLTRTGPNLRVLS